MFLTRICTLLLILGLQSSDGANIFAAVFTPSLSHQVTFQPIWRALSLRGHNVTLLTTNPINDATLTNLTEIDLSMSYDINAKHNASELPSNPNMTIIQKLHAYLATLHEIGDAQFQHPQVKELIRIKPKYDLVMVEVIHPVHLAFAWHFDAPFIGLVSLDALPRTHAAIGNPINPGLYPTLSLPFGKDLTFLQRVVSFVEMVLFTHWFSYYVFYPTEDETVRKHFGADAPPLAEIEKNMSFLFTNVNPAMSVRPITPNTIQIGGGLHLGNAQKPLSSELVQFLDEATQGFIFFSLGTNAKSSALPKTVINTMLQTFKALPYKILWKFEDETLDNLPGNVKIVKWVASQPAILAHKNIKAFITQCGLQSMEEAMFATVPMIGLPVITGSDQKQNAEKMEKSGFGRKLDLSTLEETEFKSVIMDVAQNQSYRENLKKHVELITDTERTGLERAIWWTEYAIRHKGAPHLHNPGVDMPLFKYLMLDVVAFLAVILFTTAYVLVKIICFVFRKLFGRSAKVKKD